MIKSGLKNERLDKKRLEKYKLNQERMKTYYKEILRHDKNSKEEA